MRVFVCVSALLLKHHYRDIFISIGEESKCFGLKNSGLEMITAHRSIHPDQPDHPIVEEEPR